MLRSLGPNLQRCSPIVERHKLGTLQRQLRVTQSFVIIEFHLVYVWRQDLHSRPNFAGSREFADTFSAFDGLLWQLERQQHVSPQGNIVYLQARHDVHHVTGHSDTAHASTVSFHTVDALIGLHGIV
jgi:hypothetical protein